MENAPANGIDQSQSDPDRQLVRVRREIAHLQEVVSLWTASNIASDSQQSLDSAPSMLLASSSGMAECVRSNPSVSFHPARLFAMWRQLVAENVVPIASAAGSQTQVPAMHHASSIPYASERHPPSGPLPRWRNETCAICMEPLLHTPEQGSASSFDLRNAPPPQPTGPNPCPVVQGSCSHSFHEKCMTQWVKQSLAALSHRIASRNSSRSIPVNDLSIEDEIRKAVPCPLCKQAWRFAHDSEG